MTGEEIKDIILLVALVAGMCLGAVFLIAYNSTKNKIYKKLMIGSYVVVGATTAIAFSLSGATLEDLFNGGSKACQCEKEMHTWAIGGNTFNTSLKEECLEKYAGFKFYYAEPSLNTYTTAWKKAQSECKN